MDFTADELADEIWRPVVGYEGYYEVSDLGRVRSLDRVVTALNRWGSFNVYNRKGRLLRPRDSAEGYYYGVALCVEGVVQSRDIHPLVMQSFVGPRPEGLLVAHNDGNGHNNRLGNLRYDTYEGNAADCVTHGTWGWGAQCGGKLAPEDVWHIRRMRGKVYQKDVAKKFGVCQQVIQKVQAGLTYKSVVNAP